MSNNNNPFADAFKSFGELNVPAVDYKEVLSSSRKNIEAAIAISQVFAEGVQTIARKQAEIARNSTQELVDLWKEVSSSKSVEAGAAKQAEFAKSAVEQSLNNSRELFDIASKAGTQAYEMLSKQAQDAANDLTKAASKKKASNQ